jgi:hypothetical protein
MQFPQGYFEGITSGTHYYVHDSDGNNNNDGLLATTAKATLINAVATATANKHDVIWLLPGHVETISSAAALTIDKADITVIFLGTGANKAQIKFDTSVNADVDIDAAGITFICPRFVVDIDALVGGIDVNAADFTMINVEDYDSAGKAATDMIIADGNADRLKIIGYKYFESTTGTQKESRLQIAAADDILLQDIDIVGDFDTGAIENGTAWVDATLRNISIDNQAPGPVVGILLQATSTGKMENVNIRVASGTTYLTVNNDMQFFNCHGVGTDGAAGDIVGSTPTTGIEGKIDTITSVLSGADGIATFPAAAAPANNVSLAEVIRYVYDLLQGANGVVTWAAGAAAANGVSMSEALRYVQENVIVGTGTALPGNSSLFGVLAGATGIPTMPASAIPANNVSMMEVIREIYDQQEKGISGSDAVMVDDDTIFTIAGGPIEIIELVSECITLNDGTASTLQYSTDPTVGVVVTISGASASLANAAAGSGVVLNKTALATAPDLIDPLVGLSGVKTRGIIVAAGIIKVTIGVGSTTGTWRHHLRYRPLRRGVTVTAA